jgi:hypothetical protein
MKNYSPDQSRYFIIFVPSINNTIDAGFSVSKTENNIRCHFNGLVAYLDINVNFK